MRIAVWHNLPSGGAKRALYDQVRGLVERGHQVEAWCPPTAHRDYLPLSDLVRENVVPLTLKAYLESKPHLLRQLHPLNWSSRLRLRAMKRHCRECARQIQAKGFDLLFAACCMFFHTPLIARFTRLPSVVYLQEPNRRFYECLPELPWVATSWSVRDLRDAYFWQTALIRRFKLPGIRVRAREERINALAFQRILVNSFFSRESVLRAFGIDSKVCYLGIDTNKFINQYRKREGFMVSVAALLPNKNIEFLIRSLSKIGASRRPRLLLIANIVSRPYLEKIRELADELGVKFELKQKVKDAELVDLLNRARIMLYAPRLEPFGYAPLEANACGLPVVAVAEGGVRESIQDGENGLLVEHEPESMAWAIERLLVDDELHQRLSQQAHQMVQTRWSLQSSLDRLEHRLMIESGIATGASGPFRTMACTT
jgi:glycosyltransferase involved in cell wall biosynthesis